MAKNAKKGDMIEIENHCTMKMLLGTLVQFSTVQCAGGSSTVGPGSWDSGVPSRDLETFTLDRQMEEVGEAGSPVVTLPPRDNYNTMQSAKSTCLPTSNF